LHEHEALREASSRPLAFYKLDNTWRRLPAERQASAKLEFGETIESFAGRLLLRPYGLVGIRGDCDFLLWQVAEDLDSLVALQTPSTARRGGVSRAPLQLPRDDPAVDLRVPGGSEPAVAPRHPASEARYLFVYPFTKTRAWYMLPKAERQTMMDEHVRIGRKYPSIRLNTTYSYGLDDQEFIVAFEGDTPGDFLDLVMELRESQASSYTSRDTPLSPACRCPSGICSTRWGVRVRAGDLASAYASRRYTPVATLADLPAGASRRVYVGGDAVALFNVQGTVYAIANRCTHARASLSEGSVDAARCSLTCPWHEGVFSLETGQVLGGPPSLPVAAYR